LAAHDVAAGARVPVRRGVGIAVALAGIAVLAIDSDQRVSALGIVLLTVTGVAWGLYTAAGRVNGDRDPRVATTANFVLVAAVVALPATIGVVAGLRVTTIGLAWAAAMGAVTTALAYVAWYICQRSMSATVAGSSQLVIPILTAAGAVLLLGEELSARLLVAAVLVAGGLWLGRPDRPRMGHSAP
jgi:drug/metabolite transporter (DMT)-like permease